MLYLERTSLHVECSLLLPVTNTVYSTVRMDILVQMAHFYDSKPLVRYENLDTKDDLACLLPPSHYLLGSWGSPI
jgi:hypothetical protein